MIQNLTRVLLLTLVLSGLGRAEQGNSPEKLTPRQQEILSGSERHDRNGWIYLRCSGEPRVLGFQHGYPLSREISASLAATRLSWRYHSGMEWGWLVRRADTMFTPMIGSELLEELGGMAEGLAAAGVTTTVAELIAFNGIIELEGYWWPTVKAEIGARSPNPPKEGCSSFIATGSWTADGGIVLGHNTMTSYTSADCNIIFDLLPARGNRILMQGCPGWVHSGTDFFITGAGLVGSETTISGFSGFDPKGIPEFVRMRRAAQDARTIDEWCAIMKRGNNGGYANAWLIGDVNTGEIARLELGLKYTALERTRDGYYTGSNVAENLQILRFETNTHETDIRNTDVSRRVRWKQLMAEHRGRITLQAGMRFEGDHFDTYLEKPRLGYRSLCAHWEDETLDPDFPPFNPYGTVDGKVVDSRMAKQMAFMARWGSGCGTPFNAADFLRRHPQFEWMTGILRSRGSHPWTEFRSGE